MNRDALFGLPERLTGFRVGKTEPPGDPCPGRGGSFAGCLCVESDPLVLPQSRLHLLSLPHHVHLAGHHGGRPAPGMFAAGTQQVLEKLCLDTNQHPPTLLRTRQQEAVHPTHSCLTDLEQADLPQKERAQYAQIHALHQRANEFFAKLAWKKTTFPQRWSFFMPRKISKTPPPLGRSCPRWCVPRRTTPA